MRPRAPRSAQGTSLSLPRASVPRPGTTAWAPRAADSDTHAADSDLRTADSGWRPADSGPRAATSDPCTAGCGPRAPGSDPRPADSGPRPAAPAPNPLPQTSEAPAPSPSRPGPLRGPVPPVDWAGRCGREGRGSAEAGGRGASVGVGGTECAGEGVRVGGSGPLPTSARSLRRAWRVRCRSLETGATLSVGSIPVPLTTGGTRTPARSLRCGTPHSGLAGGDGGRASPH